jgi:hypothetical protein
MDPSSANFSKNTTRLSINNLSVLKDHITVYSASKHNSTAAICLLVRNETLYIDEFMDFHISLGFKVYLYDNSANSVTDDLDLHLWYSKRKDIQKYVKIIHFPQAPAQVAAYLQVSVTSVCQCISLRSKNVIYRTHHRKNDNNSLLSSVLNMMLPMKHSLL